MSIEVIQQKLLTYQCQTILDQENALKEIAQEIALMSLSRAGFFKKAAFQGGTCLRILYGLNRFSEDLDFVLEEADTCFNWDTYMDGMEAEFRIYGYALEVINKNKLDKAVKTAFLKAESEGGLLVLKDIRTNRPKMQIKLEIDTHPPAGSVSELKFLDFPLPFSVRTQNAESLFAGKLHALLCRSYTKGRDWYDFVWYVSRKTEINVALLQNAIHQKSPWENQDVTVNKRWVCNELSKKIKNIDWIEAKKDIARFLRPHEFESLSLWSESFFLSRVDKLKGE
ncbi:MAG: nucleotidyl transferase AbiEii/AbiGii toxin family protein [Gammaproteobacteria bacterium]